MKALKSVLDSTFFSHRENAKIQGLLPPHVRVTFLDIHLLNFLRMSSGFSEMGGGGNRTDRIFKVEKTKGHKRKLYSAMAVRAISHPPPLTGGFMY